MKTLTITDIMTDFLDSIRAYEHESGKSIHFDERESSEFVDIYFNNEGKLKTEKQELLSVCEHQNEWVVNRNNMIQRKVDGWGDNYHSPIEKIKKEAYKEGFSAGKNYIKDNVKLTVANDALAATFQTLRHYREGLIKWLERL